MDQTSTSAIINAESIENLPVSEISDLIELQAGVVKNESGGFHIRGGRTGEVSFWVMVSQQPIHMITAQDWK